jgi:O-antigen ligase
MPFVIEDADVPTAEIPAAASSRVGGIPPSTALHRVVACLVPLVALAAVVALSFRSGGYIFARTAPVAFILLLLAIAWAWLAPRRVTLDLPALVALAAFALLVVWEGLSVAWSIGPDLSWAAFDVAALYLTAAAVLTGTSAGRLQLRIAGYGLVVALMPVAAYAFLGKVLPDVVTHAHFYARLSAPVGYWNVLAILMAIAALPALEGASRTHMPLVARALLAAALALFLFTLFFTFSRGGTLAFILGLVVYFALTNERLQGVLSLGLAAAPVAAALCHLRHLDTLFNPTVNDGLRTVQGHALGRWALAAVILAALAQFVAALVTRRVRLAVLPRRVLGAVVLAGAIGLVVTGGLAFSARYGGVGRLVHNVTTQFTSSEASGGGTPSSASRLLSIGNNGRIPMIREGLDGYPHHPLAGAGAGTFRFTNYLYRTTESMVVKHAHNQWINVLSELGIVGLVLFVLAIGGLLVAALRPIGRAARDADRGLLAALQAGAAAFVAHMSVDWDWDMAAATLTFLLIVGVSAAYVRGRRAGLAQAADGPAATAAGPPARAPWSTRHAFGLGSRAFVTGALVLVGVSWLFPYLSERAYSRALGLAGDNKVAPAIAAARDAHRLEPLAVDPLFTLARLQQQQGKARDAIATLLKAQHLQPQNFAVYYQLGLMQLNVLGLKRDAADSFLRALSLNPHDHNALYELSTARSP